MIESGDQTSSVVPVGTIVVGYDGTESAERAVARASQFARAFAARVIVADVAIPEVSEIPPAGGFGLVPYLYTDSSEQKRTNEALWRQHRAKIEGVFGAAAVEYEFAGRVGEPVQEVVDIAEQHRADLIVVGTREPSLLERLLGGSVSQGVARRARCDVLIVHPPGESD